MRKIKGLRWYMIALVTLGTVLGYLTRNTVAAAAPTLMEELHISTQQYSYIIAAYSAAYTVMQPVAGYVLDILGTKVGYAFFAIAWAIFCGSTALAGSWGGLALATQNSALAAIVEKMWTQRVHNPYWKKLHEHIDLRTVDNWCDDHDQILKALLRKDPNAAKLAMWQHLENTKQMLFNETSDDFEFNADRYLFAENPVVHLDTAANGAK